MPDGTIVTTVTTIQSRPKADCKLGEAVPRQAGRYGGTDRTVIFLRMLHVSSSKTVQLLYIAVVADSHLARCFWLLGCKTSIVTVLLAPRGWLETCL